MSRIDRLKEYSKPQSGWQGCGRDQANIDRWADRASANSDGDEHRASDGPMKLPSTKINVRDTAMAPRVSRNVERTIKAARADVNHVGSSYMSGIRRTTT